MKSVNNKTLSFCDMPVAYHGLAAFRGGKSGFKVARKGLLINEIEGSICIADKPIGKIGVMVQGEVSFLFASDCWSAAEERDNGDFDYRYLGYKTEGCNNNEFLETLDILRKSEESKEYCEGWMKDPTIVGVWVHSSINTEQMKAARVIARKHGVRVRVLEENEQL